MCVIFRIWIRVGFLFQDITENMLKEFGILCNMRRAMLTGVACSIARARCVSVAVICIDFRWGQYGTT